MIKTIYSSNLSKQQNGFTLVELLIVLALSGLLSSALFQVVLNNKQNIVLTDSFARVQEAARFSLSSLSRDLRMAGYMGCVNASMDGGKIISLLKSSDPQYDPQLHDYTTTLSAIDNYEVGEVGHPASIGGIVPIEGTDIFISNATLSSDIKMKADHGAGAPTFTAVGPTEQLMVLRKGMVVLATDCNVARIFAISNDIDAVGKTEVDVSHNISVSNGPDNVSTGLSIIFPSGSQILFMSRMTYFIGPSQLIPGQNSLYRHSTIEGAVAQELVPYVENMQLTYGVDTNNDTIADTYKTAAQIATDGEDMTADVYSINVDLQVATNVDNSLSRALVGDGVFRKRYTQLISIRNAGFGQY